MDRLLQTHTSAQRPCIAQRVLNLPSLVLTDTGPLGSELPPKTIASLVSVESGANSLTCPLIPPLSPG